MSAALVGDLPDILETAGLPWTYGRTIGVEVTTPDGQTTFHVTEDDGTFRLTVMDASRAILSEATLSGTLAVAMLLGAIDAIVSESA